MIDEKKYNDLINSIEMNVWQLCQLNWTGSIPPFSLKARIEYEDRKVRVLVRYDTGRTVYVVWIRRDAEERRGSKELTLVFKVVEYNNLARGRRVLRFRFGRWVEYLNEARSQQRLPASEPDLADGTDLLVGLEET
jgi:hypothetical protein